MNSKFSATTTAKQVKGATNPFDEIVALEQREKERVEKEIAAMRREEQEVQQALAVKQQDAEEQLRQQARKELKTYREQELTTLLQVAKSEATEQEKALEKTSEAKKDDVAATLVQNMLSQYSVAA